MLGGIGVAGFKSRKTRLAGLAMLAMLLFLCSAVYAAEEFVAPTPVFDYEVDIFYNTTKVYSNKGTYTLTRTLSLKIFSPIVGDWDTKATESEETVMKTDDVKETGKTDADYFLVEKELEMWQNDTTYYVSGYLDNAKGKLVIYTDKLYADKIAVKVNNTEYYNESGLYNHSGDFWWLPLPKGKLCNITISGVTQKTVFTLARTVWYTVDYRFVSSDADNIANEPLIDETIDTEEDTVLIGTEDLDELFISAIDKKLEEIGREDLIGEYVYNLTRIKCGFTNMKYSTIQLSVAGFIVATFEKVSLAPLWDIAGALKSSVKRLHFAIASTASTVVRRIQSSSRYISSNVARFGNDIYVGVKRAVDKSAEWASGGVKAVGEFFDNTAKTVTGAVKNFADKIVQGATSVYRAVSTWAGNVYNGVKNFFGGIVSWFKKFWWAILLVVILFVLLIGIFVLQPLVQSRAKGI